MEHIKIYTDGGCSGNPGPGGWGYVIIDGPRETRASGGEAATTNNRMELIAVIRALEDVSGAEHLRSRHIEVHTDSQYVKNGITAWIHTWLKNGWKTAAKKPVKNRDLWQRLKALQDTLDISWHWVKGHAGHEYNEVADSLVGKEIEKFMTN